MSRRAVEALREFREANLFLRGIVPLLGFRSTTVEYDRLPRRGGRSKYSLNRMLALAADGITSFSVVPLRLISLVGLAVFAGAMGVTLWALWASLFTDKTIPGSPRNIRGKNTRYSVSSCRNPAAASVASRLPRGSTGRSGRTRTR
jgi:polyisoprenyl-phosphate glycosyltransferase